MYTINQRLIDLMRDRGVPQVVIDNYRARLPESTDNLETIGYFWCQQIASLNVNIRTHADICILLRDVGSEILWFNIFNERVIPILTSNHILEVT